MKWIVWTPGRGRNTPPPPWVPRSRAEMGATSGVGRGGPESLRFVFHRQSFHFDTRGHHTKPVRCVYSERAVTVPSHRLFASVVLTFTQMNRSQLAAAERRQTRPTPEPSS